MNVLGQVKVSWLIHFNALLGLGTLLLCYSLARGYHHVPPFWPVPMISDCAVKSPEKFPFRLGIVTTALLMGLINVLVFLSGVFRSKVAVMLGVVGSLLLAVVGVVNEEEASKVHSVSAILFFLFYWIYMILVTFYSSWILFPCYGTTRPVSAWTKVMVVSRQTLTFLCGIAVVLAIIVSSSGWDKDQAYLALCEWSGTFCIMAFNSSFSSDLSGVYVAEIIDSQTVAYKNEKQENDTNKKLITL